MKNMLKCLALLYAIKVEGYVLTAILDIIRLEPNMLKNLPIIPSQTSQNFYPLFFFILIAPPIIPFLLYCVDDNITMQE